MTSCSLVAVEMVREREKFSLDELQSCERRKRCSEELQL